MDPLRLRPAVEMPVRRGRSFLIGAGLAILFSMGAFNYMASMRGHCPYARMRRPALTFTTEPQGAEVVRERDGATLCLTPCRVEVDVGRFGVAGFRLVRDGFLDRQVLVDLRGGDTSVEAVLQPTP